MKGNFQEKILPYGIAAVLALALLLTFCGPEKKTLVGTSVSEWDDIVSLETIMDGSAQKSFQKWYNENFNGYFNTIRVHNQIEYSVFNDACGGFIQGKDGYCFSGAQSNLYVLGDEANPCSWEEYEEYAKQVAELQKQLIEQGKEFLYLLTPSKTEIMNEYLPWNLRILEERYADSDNSSRAMMIRAFEKYGVKYYDTKKDILELKDIGENRIYYKSGHHWSLSAASQEISKVISHIDENGCVGLSYPQIRVIGSRNEVYPTDMDIINAQNLLFFEKENYQIPVIECKPCENSVFIFGTSYGRELFDSLHDYQGIGAFKKSVYMQYFTEMDSFSDGRLNVSYFEPDEREDKYGISEMIDEADLIIMEQNAILGVRGTHQRFVDIALKGLE